VISETRGTGTLAWVGFVEMEFPDGHACQHGPSRHLTEMRFDGFVLSRVQPERALPMSGARGRGWRRTPPPPPPGGGGDTAVAVAGRGVRVGGGGLGLTRRGGAEGY